MEEVRLRWVVGRREQGGAPPVGHRDTHIVAVDVLVSMSREDVVVIVGVHLHVDAELFEVVEAGDAVGLALGARQRRQQQRGQNGNDRNHDQQLDEREPRSECCREPSM